MASVSVVDQELIFRSFESIAEQVTTDPPPNNRAIFEAIVSSLRDTHPAAFAGVDVESYAKTVSDDDFEDELEAAMTVSVLGESVKALRKTGGEDASDFATTLLNAIVMSVGGAVPPKKVNGAASVGNTLPSSQDTALVAEPFPEDIGDGPELPLPFGVFPPQDRSVLERDTGIGANSISLIHTIASVRISDIRNSTSALAEFERVLKPKSDGGLGMDANTPAVGGYTALHYAIRADNYLFVRAVLSHQPKTQVNAVQNISIVDHAVANGSAFVILMLLEHYSKRKDLLPPEHAVVRALFKAKLSEDPDEPYYYALKVYPKCVKREHLSSLEGRCFEGVLQHIASAVMGATEAIRKQKAAKGARGSTNEGGKGGKEASPEPTDVVSTYRGDDVYSYYEGLFTQFFADAPTSKIMAMEPLMSFFPGLATAEVWTKIPDDQIGSTLSKFLSSTTQYVPLQEGFITPDVLQRMPANAFRDVMKSLASLPQSVTDAAVESFINSKNPSNAIDLVADVLLQYPSPIFADGIARYLCKPSSLKLINSTVASVAKDDKELAEATGGTGAPSLNDTVSMIGFLVILLIFAQQRPVAQIEAAIQTLPAKFQNVATMAKKHIHSKEWSGFLLRDVEKAPKSPPKLKTSGGAICPVGHAIKSGFAQARSNRSDLFAGATSTTAADVKERFRRRQRDAPVAIPPSIIAIPADASSDGDANSAEQYGGKGPDSSRFTQLVPATSSIGPITLPAYKESESEDSHTSFSRWLSNFGADVRSRHATNNSNTPLDGTYSEDTWPWVVAGIRAFVFGAMLGAMGGVSSLTKSDYKPPAKLPKTWMAAVVHCYSLETPNLYGPMNASMLWKTGELYIAFSPMIGALSAALEALPSAKFDTVYRGLGISYAASQQIRSAEHTWPGFTSTSLDVFASAGFLPSNRKSAMFRIQGVSGVDISWCSLYPEEAEVLLKPNSKIQVSQAYTAVPDTWGLEKPMETSKLSSHNGPVLLLAEFRGYCNAKDYVRCKCGMSMVPKGEKSSPCCSTGIMTEPTSILCKNQLDKVLVVHKWLLLVSSHEIKIWPIDFDAENPPNKPIATYDTTFMMYNMIAGRSGDLFIAYGYEDCPTKRRFVKVVSFNEDTGKFTTIQSPMDDKITHLCFNESQSHLYVEHEDGNYDHHLTVYDLSDGNMEQVDSILSGRLGPLVAVDDIIYIGDMATLRYSSGGVKMIGGHSGEITISAERTTALWRTSASQPEALIAMDHESEGRKIFLWVPSTDGNLPTVALLDVPEGAPGIARFTVGYLKDTPVLIVAFKDAKMSVWKLTPGGWGPLNLSAPSRSWQLQLEAKSWAVPKSIALAADKIIGVYGDNKTRVFDISDI